MWVVVLLGPSNVEQFSAFFSRKFREFQAFFKCGAQRLMTQLNYEKENRERAYIAAKM